MEARDQVLRTFYSPVLFISSTLFSSSGAAKGPFLILLLIDYIPSLLRVAALDYELIGAVLSLAGLVAQRRLAPRSDGARTSDRGLALAAAVRVVAGVHDGAADGGPPAHVALAAGLADLDVGPVGVAYLANGGLSLIHI